MCLCQPVWPPGGKRHSVTMTRSFSTWTVGFASGAVFIGHGEKLMRPAVLSGDRALHLSARLCICTLFRNPSVTHPLLTAPIGRSLWQLAGPTTAVMVVQTFVAIAETFFFGRLGTDALAGFALVFPFMMLMTDDGGRRHGRRRGRGHGARAGRQADRGCPRPGAACVGAGPGLRAALHPARLDGRSGSVPAAGRPRRGAGQCRDLQPRAVHRLDRGMGQLLPGRAAARRRRCRDARPLHAVLLAAAGPAQRRAGAGHRRLARARHGGPRPLLAVTR